MHKTSDERGNVLFLILLAVVLFAALSYAVTSAVQGGGNDTTKEQAKSYAAAITQFGTMLDNTVERLRLVGGCADTAIRFGASGTQSCRVYDSLGGGLTPLAVSEKWLDPYFASSPWGTTFYYGSVFYPGNVSIFGPGTNYNELMLTIPFISDAVCQAINEGLGLPYPLYPTGSNGALSSTIDLGVWNGTYIAGYVRYLRATLSSSAPTYAPRSFCMTGPWAYGNPEPGKNLNLFVQIVYVK